MDASYRIILFLMIYCFSSLVFAQDYEEPEGLGPRIFRFHKNAHRVKSIKQPDSMKDKDLSYPGCGFRSPMIQGTSAQISTTRGRRRCLFAHRGKRSTAGLLCTVKGGSTAKENSWPWMVAIYDLEDKGEENDEKENNAVYCGASLISRKYALTAAHCFDAEDGSMRNDSSKFSVVIGAHTTDDGTEYPVRKILIHPGYKQPQNYDDIALIEFRRPVKLSKKVFPVCLPSAGLKDNNRTDNSNVTVIGWGRTSEGGNSSRILQEVTVPIVPLKECNASYGISPEDLPRGITEKQICAGVWVGGKDACQGDSGGPLVSKLKDNSYVQLGIVAFGEGCGLRGYPGVYTRVSEYTKWIYANTDLGSKV